MSDPSVTPALAAHRESLVAGFHDANCDCGDPSSHGAMKVAAWGRQADVALAYFADPAHGLTVETGEDDDWHVIEDDGLRPEQRCGKWGGCRLPRGHNDGQLESPQAHGALLPAHGLVRDEPSEDERACTSCGRANEACEEAGGSCCDPCSLTGGCSHAPARSDDGRTAVELTDDEVASHTYMAVEGPMFTVGAVERILAARLRHDDGEADRGE